MPLFTAHPSCPMLAISMSLCKSGGPMCHSSPAAHYGNHARLASDE